MRLFLYGTLLDPDLLTRIAGRPVRLVPAVISGWRRVAWGDGRYPTLRRAPGRVNGAIAIIDGPALWRLAAYEGHSYRLTPVLARTSGGVVPAKAWIAAGGTLRAWAP